MCSQAAAVRRREETRFIQGSKRELGSYVARLQCTPCQSLSRELFRLINGAMIRCFAARQGPCNSLKHRIDFQAPLESRSCATREEGESMKSVGLLALWACRPCGIAGLVLLLLFFFFSTSLHLKHNIKFRLYKIKIMHVNKLFLYNVMK